MPALWAPRPYNAEENGHLGMAENDEREQGAERWRVVVMVRGQGSSKAVEHWCMGELEAALVGGNQGAGGFGGPVWAMQKAQIRLSSAPL